ncbi:MAG: hypothetical protein Q9195_001563 [Heterodermia aff. obscurata]
MSFDTPLPPYNATDPHATFLNSSCLDLLLIELVPMAYRIADELSQREYSNTIETGLVRMKTGVGAGSVKGGGGGGGGGSTLTGTATGTGAEEEEDGERRREGAYRRLDALGYRVGQGIVERFSRDRPRFTDTLDMIKFLCKDVWQLIFRKQIDNLKTNHRGIYVLTDNTFRPLARMSMASPAEAVVKAQPFLWFPSGVMRGALASMGLNTTVHAETSELPGAVFQIKTDHEEAEAPFEIGLIFYHAKSFSWTKEGVCVWQSLKV